MDNSENNFHKALEQDIDNLSQEINKVKESNEGGSFEKKEVVKKSFKNISTETQSNQRKTKKKKPKKRKSKKESFLPDYMQESDITNKEKLQVEKLMDLVIHKGLLKALKESKKQPPFIQDAFHDALADKLLPELKKRNII